MSEANNLPPLEWIQNLPKSAKESIERMATLRQLKDEADEVLTELNKKYDYIRLVHIPKMMEDEGIENMRLKDIGLCYLTPVVRAQIVPDKRAEAFQWLSDVGRGSLVTETVNAQTLSAAVKQMLANNEEVPGDLIKVTALTQANIRKG